MPLVDPWKFCRICGQTCRPDEPCPVHPPEEEGDGAIQETYDEGFVRMEWVGGWVGERAGGALRPINIICLFEHLRTFSNATYWYIVLTASSRFGCIYQRKCDSTYKETLPMRDFPQYPHSSDDCEQFKAYYKGLRRHCGQLHTFKVSPRVRWRLFSTEICNREVWCRRRSPPVLRLNYFGFEGSSIWRNIFRMLLSHRAGNTVGEHKRRVGVFNGKFGGSISCREGEFLFAAS